MNCIGNLSSFFEVYNSSCGYLQSKLTKQNIKILVIANAIFALITINTTIINTPVSAAIIGTEGTVGLLFAIHFFFFSHLSKNKPIPVNTLLNAMNDQLKNIPIAEQTYNKAKLFFNICSDGKQCCGSLVIDNDNNKILTKNEIDNQINDYIKNLHGSSFEKKNDVELKFIWLIAFRRIDLIENVGVFDYSAILASHRSTICEDIENISVMTTQKVKIEAIQRHVLQFMDDLEVFTFD